MNQGTPNQVTMEIKSFVDSSGPHLEKGRQLLASLKRLCQGGQTEPYERLKNVLNNYLTLYERELVPLLVQEPKAEKPSVAKNKTANHRVIPRFHQKLPIRFSSLGKSPQWNKGYSHDVGAMGLFILSNRLEKVGQTLNIEIEVPDLGKVNMQGTVVWTKWVPPSLRMVEYTGFGVKISHAPESWFKYFLNLKRR